MPLDLSPMKRDVPIHVVIDSTGLKVYGEGEWKTPQHGVRKRRIWRKLHIGVDAATGEVVAEELMTARVTNAEVCPHLLHQIDESISYASRWSL